MRSVLVFMVSNRGYHGGATANRQRSCALRNAARQQKRAAEATLVLPIAAVPRDENAA